MTKIIVHPGNGVDFPKNGDYVKLNLAVYDSDRNLLFDSKLFLEQKKILPQKNASTAEQLFIKSSSNTLETCGRVILIPSWFF